MKRLLLAVFLVAGAASAQITDFQNTPIEGGPAASQQAVDAFGNVWVVDPANTALGEIDSSLAYTAYPVPSDEHAGLYNLATTPDGSVWYADYAHPIVGRRSTDGQFHRYTVPESPYFIAGAADGGVYFSFISNPHLLGHLTADGLTYRQFTLPAGAVVENLTVGPDGAAYFTDLRANHRIVRAAPDGSVRSYPVSAANPPSSFTWYPSITTGPDGNMWFSHATAIGRLKRSDGAITEYPIPYADADASGITAGGDGNVWFADSFAGAGVVSQLVVSTATDDGHATINPSPGIGEPIGILAIAPEPGRATPGVSREGIANVCIPLKFIVEQNQATGSNLAVVSAAAGPKCAEVEVKVVGFRTNADDSEGKMGIAITNAGPDPAEGLILDFDPYGTTSVAANLPNWDCSEFPEHIICNRTGPLASGGEDVGEFDFQFDAGKPIELEGNVVSATPDPSPYNFFSQYVERLRIIPITWENPKKVKR
ncbi:MAG TPA: hypothetical protein VFL12_09305 [Thermoanaerobaculia bacterium]|nr:hypothetical protein [Thermoanaerobaculia bacterium]